MGKMAGSAAGAKKRMATCAMAKAPKRAKGRPSVDTVTSVPVLATYIA